jgi:hypothetical protein
MNFPRSKELSLLYISQFFGKTTFHKKIEKQEEPFMDDFVLLVIKGLFILNIVENLWMKQFVLRRDLVWGFHRVEL